MESHDSNAAAFYLSLTPLLAGQWGETGVIVPTVALSDLKPEKGYDC